MKHSVIVPTCARPDALAACLRPLAPGTQRAAPGSYEVIVTDDSDDDRTETMLRRDFGWVRWTPGPRRGPAANRNHGATLATGDWLVFTDDDCLPGADWLAAYAAAADREPAVAVLEGPTLPEGERRSVDMDAPLNLEGGFLWSCNFAIRRDRFAALRGFDEGFDAATMEDVELALRLQERGVPRRFVPAAAVRHPWRRRKGRRQLRAYARSVRRFVDLHPEQAAAFSLRRTARNMAAAIVRLTSEGLRRHGGRGVLRSAGLELYMFFAVARALRAKAPDRIR